MEKLLEILAIVWAFLNSSFGLGMVITAVTWIGAKIYLARPSWRKYEGAIIEAIKFAEREIPDDTPNKSLCRINAALQYVLKIHREINNRAATAEELAELKEGIRIMHAELEANGNLNKPPSTLAAIVLCLGLLFSGLGCQVIFQAPESGPATVGSPNNSAVTTDGQDTESNQNALPTDETEDTPDDVGN